MTPERLEELRVINSKRRPYAEALHVEELIAEIDRLRAPVDVGDPDGFVMYALRAGGANEHTQRRTADLIGRLVRERDLSQRQACRLLDALAPGLDKSHDVVGVVLQIDNATVGLKLRAEAAEAEVVRLRNNLMCAHGNGCKCIDCAHARAVLEKSHD